MTEDEKLKIDYSDYVISILEGVHAYINERLLEEPNKMRRALVLNRVIGNLAISFYRMNLDFTSQEMIKKDKEIQEKLK